MPPDPEPVLLTVSATPLTLESVTPSTLEALSDGLLTREVSTPHPRDPSSSSSAASEASTPGKESADKVHWNRTTEGLEGHEECASPLRAEVVGLEALRHVSGTSPSATRYGVRARRPLVSPLVVDILRGEAVEGIAGRGGSPEFASDAVAASGAA